MNVLYQIATLGLLAVTYGIPMPQSGGQGLVPGVFIPAAAFKSLQERANANNPPANPNQSYQNPQPSYQPNTNAQPNNQVYQPNQNVQPSYQPANNVQYQQPAIAVRPNNQPVMTNQAQPLIADRIGQPNSNRPTVVMTNPQNPQPGQQIIYVQQPPQQNRPTIVVAQPQQPLIVSQQPSNGLVIQNPSSGQPGNVIVASPSNGYQNPNTGNVYTLIPLNTQNPNTNAGSYLIPIQSGNSNPIVLSTGR